MKIGVIGYGHRMAEVLRRLKADTPDTEICCVSDPARDRVRDTMKADGLWSDRCRFYTDADRMLDETAPDGVMVGTRCSLHARMGIIVLRHKLPLFLEKPIATDWEDAMALWNAYLEAGRPEVVVSFPLRLTRLLCRAKEYVDSGRLGEIAQVQAVNNVPYGPGYFQRWYRDEKETGGLFLQKATHDIDAVNCLLGKKPSEVCAMISKQIFRGNEPAGMRCDRCPKAETCTESPDNLKRFFNENRRDLGCCFAVDTGNEDSGSAIIQYPDGLHCVYTQNFYARKKAARRMIRLLGYRGTLEFDWYTDEIRIFMHDSGITETIRVPAGDGEHSGGDDALVHSFSACIRNHQSSLSPLSAGMDSILTCLAARQSALEHRFVRVPDYRGA